MMKRNKIHYLTGMILCLFLWSSCEDNSIFDQSAEERRNEVFNKTKEVLSGSSTGWVMEYFAIPENGGHNLLMRFTKDGDVTMAGKHLWTNYEYIEYDSRYEMVTSNGPVMEFDTYNEVLHPFIDPDNIKDGTNGDFEFLIEEVTDKQIKLRGRKTQTIVHLNKLPDQLSWTDYMSAIDLMQDLLLSEGSPMLYLKIEEAYFPIVRTERPVWGVVVDDSVARWSFIPTIGGFRLYSPSTILGREIQYFSLNDAKDKLICDTDPYVEIIADAHLTKFFIENKNVKWVLYPDMMYASMKILYEQIQKRCKELYSIQNIEMSIAYNNSKNTHTLTLTGKTKQNKRYEASLFFALTANTQAELNISQHSIEGVHGDENGLKMSADIPELKTLYGSLQQTFMVQTETPINPLRIKFTEKQNPDRSFELSRK